MRGYFKNELNSFRSTGCDWMNDVNMGNSHRYLYKIMSCGRLFKTGLCLTRPMTQPWTKQHRLQQTCSTSRKKSHSGISIARRRSEITFSQCPKIDKHMRALFGPTEQHLPLASILKIEISAAFTWLNSAVSSENTNNYKFIRNHFQFI